ncbi:MAG: GNAT family N-acetyltransferase [Galactobacter sp.]
MSHPRTTSRSVLARFLSRGPLERLPKRPDDRESLLELIAWQVLPVGAVVDEPSLNLRLRAYTEDTAMLRRALVDAGMVLRAVDGSSYTGAVKRPELVIRAVTEEDDPEVNRITRAAYLEHFDPEVEYLSYVSAAGKSRREDAETWVAERGGIMLATVTLAEAGGVWADVARARELEFRLLTVDPSVRRTGAGSGLVRAIVEEGRRRSNIDRVVLSTNSDWHAANAMYPGLGFSRAPERDWTPSDKPDLTLLVYTQDV